ncbi:hypothetical protein D9758_002200 [Tetrapyrgos nigripes]|uniref:N-acetyltransferase domain-containing protein n=1 Tax=Tetrapyrgos nigripes TaxID=182062 RepID=A0A8H5GPB4_9AGAR|nr:hypothetical protein D9758_002200 [Tetrapyrgos nigripes]
MSPFMLKTALLSGGRVVVATTMERELSDEKSKLKNGATIAGIAYWWPPRKRLPAYNIPLLLRCGVWKALKGWGLTVVKRAGIEYSGLNEKTHGTAFRDYNKKHNGEGKKALKPDDSWYLNMVMTVKEFEGQGVLSKLIRECYEHARKTKLAPFTLEASSERSRDRYAHLGFEPRTIMGVGKVDRNGLTVKKNNGEDVEGLSRQAEGVEYYCMVNWDPEV